MGLSSLSELLARKNQRFNCIPTGQSDFPAKFVANIYHETTAGLSKKDIDALRLEIGEQEELFDLLSEYGSVRLYCDSLSDDSAFYIAHPNEWEDLHKGFILWVDSLSETEKHEMLPEWLDDSIAIGEIPFSGNCYLYLIKGEHQGKVFEFEHDGFEFSEVGESVSDFLDYICTPTLELIKSIRSYARYSDGITDTQWLAESYEWDR